MISVSVVIPVKDGERHLEALLAAVLEQGRPEVLVIDSGSRDRSVPIARSAGVGVLEIPPEEFGHGRTRNYGAELTSGELICFLTQDAVPAPGWLAAYLEVFDSKERIGAAFGPHLPRAETSPMIARELGEFFAGMSTNGSPVLHRRGDIPFLSNVNSCYLRQCWEEIRFDDVGYAEDQAFGKAMLERGWIKAYHPAAAVVHAHDYGPVEFTRRYFDEYRGIRRAIGHVQPARPKAVAHSVARGVLGDRRWMREQGWSTWRRAAWTAKSIAHHSGRQAGSVLGSRSGALPDRLQRRLSLEGNPDVIAVPGASAEPTASGAVVRSVEPAIRAPRNESVLAVARNGPSRLGPPIEGMSRRERLHVAVATPPFSRGSGGHTLVFQLVRRLELMGHTCTVWLHDAYGVKNTEPASVYRRRIREWFAPIEAPVFTSFDSWHGADVALATGWETVYPLATLPGCLARAYLVSDHEPEFFASSAEAQWAARTYELGFFAISGGEWLHELISERYGSKGTWYSFGVDHDVYRPGPERRDDDTVIFYGRAATPRRAVPIGLLALEELVNRRPQTRIVIFGQGADLEASFAYDNLGVAAPPQLASAYRSATVGLCLSLTNHSLIPQEMMACGLPCVDLAGGSSERAFGSNGPVALSAAEPIALAGALETLLLDPELHRRQSELGLEQVRGATWDAAAHQVEAALRAALAEREALVKPSR